MAVIKKRKRGRPTKADALLNAAEMTQLQEVEQTLAILPELYNKVKAIALDSTHRQQLSGVKMILDRFEAHIAKMQEAADAEAAEQEAQQSQQGFSSGPSVSFEYEETGSSSSLQ